MFHVRPTMFVSLPAGPSAFSSRSLGSRSTDTSTLTRILHLLMSNGSSRIHELSFAAVGRLLDIGDMDVRNRYSVRRDGPRHARNGQLRVEPILMTGTQFARTFSMKWSVTISANSIRKSRKAPCCRYLKIRRRNDSHVPSSPTPRHMYLGRALQRTCTRSSHELQLLVEGSPASCWSRSFAKKSR